MNQRKPTEWLYYSSPYENSLDMSIYDDPDYLVTEKDQEALATYLQHCSLDEFVVTVIEIFKEKYPKYFMFLEALLQIDPRTMKEYQLPQFYRKANDLEGLEIIRDEDTGLIKKVKILFKNTRYDTHKWVEKSLEGKSYTISQNPTVYLLQEQLIREVRVGQKEIEIEINVKLGLH